MNNIVIKVEELSKQYRLGEVGTGTLSHDINRWWHKLRGKEDPYLKIGDTNDRTKKGSSEYVWSLQDINFEIQKGDSVGIIGKNGAGKSTLLKILSQVTTPTTGSVKVKGRIASLLEVGTGFHPELSGRDNVFLNGAILGMRKDEIKRKFDEIVDFAGVEKYIDTPVKRYSSGMYVRLAFAVAAYLEPEILIVDEVLAVGDAEFQKKALGKMNDVSKSDGRTVLFVSHNMGAITQLCNKCMLLENGKLIIHGNTNNVLDRYINSQNSVVERIIRNGPLSGNHFKFIIMSDPALKERSSYRFDEMISVRLHLFLPQFNNALELAMRLIDRQKKVICTIHERLEGYYDGQESVELLVNIPEEFLTPGSYSWVMCINHPGVELFDLQEDILPFTILETGSDFFRYQGVDYGSVFVKYSINKLLHEKAH
jgi:lipopolysaccharide transport system ATP-binding protein